MSMRRVNAPKQYSTTFVWAIHLVRTCLRTNFSTSHPIGKHIYAFRVTVTAVTLFQKIILNIIAHMF